MTVQYDEEKAKRVGSWLTGAFRAHPDVVNVQLSQRTLKANGEPSFSPVFQWQRSDGDAMSLARAVLETATIDAEDTGGLCRYTVTAETAAGGIKERTEIRINGAKPSGDVAPEDSPTSAGLVQQAMRHQEVSAKLALESVGTVFGLLEKMLERQDQQLQRYQDREARVMEMAERLAGADHERALEMMRKKSADELRGKAIEKLGPLVPAVMAKLLKLPPAAVAAMGLGISQAASGANASASHVAQVLPFVGGLPAAAASTTGTAAANMSQSIATDSPDELAASQEASDSFLLSFEPQQLPGLAGAMTDAQKQNLIAMYQAAQQRKEARIVAAQLSQQPQPQPEATT